jgi:5-methylcytosine-specific restriction protein A
MDKTPKTWPYTPPMRWTKAANGRTLPLNSDAWRKLRRSVLAEQPLCQYCPPGSVTPATEVDHKNNNPADNTRENLVSACKPCHSRKTNSDMGRAVRWGSAADGSPLDPRHPWHALQNR